VRVERRFFWRCLWKRREGKKRRRFFFFLECRFFSLCSFSLKKKKRFNFPPFFVPSQTTVQRPPHDQVHASDVFAQGEEEKEIELGDRVSKAVAVALRERKRKKPVFFLSFMFLKKKKETPPLTFLSPPPPSTPPRQPPPTPIISYSPSQGLYEQFRRVANLYFLLIAALSLTPVSPVSPVTNIVPLVLVMAASLAKEAFEDARRAKKDRQVRENDWSWSWSWSGESARKGEKNTFVARERKRDGKKTSSLLLSLTPSTCTP